MRQSSTVSHRHLAHKRTHAVRIGHGHFTHKNTHAKSPLRQISVSILFIITAIFAAGIVAAIIRANQIEIASIWAPQIAIEAPGFGAINTPHDDI